MALASLSNLFMLQIFVVFTLQEIFGKSFMQQWEHQLPFSPTDDEEDAASRGGKMAVLIPADVVSLLSQTVVKTVKTSTPRCSAIRAAPRHQ